jgi:hypothetical protein
MELEEKRELFLRETDFAKHCIIPNLPISEIGWLEKD